MRVNAVRAALLAALILVSGAALAGIPPQSGGPSQACPANDQANACVIGSFTGTGKSTSFLVYGPFNVLIYGSSGPNGTWAGSVQIERSFDGGTTWIVAGVGGDGAQAVYNTSSQDVSVVGDEPERGVLYRLDCTSFSSGPINYRMSTTGGAATTWAPGEPY